MLENIYWFQIISIIGSLALLVFVINSIRRGILKEKYSILWLAASSIIIALSVKKGLLDSLAGALGVAYPPSLLFLVAFIFVLLILLHFSIVISILHEKNKIITQEITILKRILKEAGITTADVPGKDE